MVKLVVGEKGTGKTKRMLEMANDKAQKAQGSIIFIDRDKKFMHSLRHSVRLVSLEEYPVKDIKSFIGFLCGIIASDHDIETIFIDRLLQLTDLEIEGVASMIKEIERLCNGHDIQFVISISCSLDRLPEELKEYDIV
jgi:hypothetical protein